MCSDLLDHQWQAGLQALLTRRFEVTVLHLLAPQEIDPVFEGDIRLVDAEGGAPVELSADVDLLNRYRENLAAWRAEIGAFASTHGIAYVPVATDIPIEELLLHLLRRRGIVR